MRTKDEDKEQLILEAALRMIMRTGLAGLKMSELAKEAGVATGTVYIYFTDKEELIRRLYLYLMRRTTQLVNTDLKDSDPLKIKIRKYCRNYLNDNLQNPEYGAFMEQYFRSPYFQETDATRTEEDRMMAPIYDLLAQGQHEGIIKDGNPELLVTLVCGMLNELAKLSLYTQQPITDSDWNLTFSIIWDGIKS
jgi:TetR/AcrR family transcriptional regulator, multidrug resistance operon repressor